MMFSAFFAKSLRSLRFKAFAGTFYQGVAPKLAIAHLKRDTC